MSKNNRYRIVIQELSIEKKNIKTCWEEVGWVGVEGGMYEQESVGQECSAGSAAIFDRWKKAAGLSSSRQVRLVLLLIK